VTVGWIDHHKKLFMLPIDGLIGFDPVTVMFSKKNLRVEERGQNPKEGGHDD
jgi:hypothetical protein